MAALTHLFQTISRSTLSHLIIALFCGYILWYTMSLYVPVTHTFSCPVYYYNTEKVSEPNAVVVSIAGPRQSISQFMAHNPAIHIDGHDITDTNKKIIVTPAHLFLPDDIKLVHCSAIELC